MKKGFTFVETMVVVLIFTFLFSAILTVLALSDHSWRVGQNKLIKQQEARRAMDNMARFLRQSSPDWVIEETNPDGSTTEYHYPVMITESNSRIDFYIPIFYPDCCPSSCQPDDSVCRDGSGNLHNAGDIVLKKITFKLNPDNPRQLLRKEGLASPVPVANEIKELRFGLANSIVTIDIVTEKEMTFTLKSQITLRNQNVAFTDIPVEESSEGEF